MYKAVVKDIQSWTFCNFQAFSVIEPFLYNLLNSEYYYWLLLKKVINADKTKRIMHKKRYH